MGFFSKFFDWLIDSGFGSWGILRLCGIPLLILGKLLMILKGRPIRRSTLGKYPISKSKILVPGKPVKGGNVFSMSCFPATNPLLQAVKIHSGASRDLCLERLASSDVRRAEASFPADKVRWCCCWCFEHYMWRWWWCHLGMKFGRGRCEVKSKWGWLVGLVGRLVGDLLPTVGGWFGVTGHRSSSSSPGPTRTPWSWAKSRTLLRRNRCCGQAFGAGPTFFETSGNKKTLGLKYVFPRKLGFSTAKSTIGSKCTDPC